MLGYGLIIGGLAAMGVGVIMFAQWASGQSRWFDAGVRDSAGASKTDRQFLNLYFIAFVIAPLLGGALAVLFGLRELL